MARSTGRAVTVVELRLETGRTHQIRVHLGAIDHAIVGDMAYGGPRFERLCLHAYALGLRASARWPADSRVRVRARFVRAPGADLDNAVRLAF